VGVNRITGKVLDGVEHIKQSIQDILTTPIGSRLINRAYGSNLPLLLDQPMNEAFTLDLISATAEAIELWEQRVKVQKVVPQYGADGTVSINLIVTYLIDGQAINLDGVVIK
jgi:phage baseplate assembly protein W